MNAKALALLPLAGLAAAAPASAGSVRVTGVLDNAIQISKAKGQGAAIEQAGNQYFTSGVHFDADEDLGQGYGVESKIWILFTPDAGTIASPDGALANHVLVAVKSPGGRFGVGRFTAFGATAGPIGRWKFADPFMNGGGDAGLQGSINGLAGEPLRNSLFYESPALGGFQAGALYSLTEENNAEGASQSENTTFWDLCASYRKGGLLLLADVQGNHYGNSSPYKQLGNRFRAKTAGAYSTGSWTFYGGWYYGRNEIKFSTAARGIRPDFKHDPANPAKDGMNGRGLDMQSAYFGVKKTAGAWDLKALGQVQWGENKGQGSGKATDPKFRHYVAAAGADYHLSKRTMLYSIASASATGKGWKQGQAAALERRRLVLGMTHRF